MGEVFFALSLLSLIGISLWPEKRVKRAPVIVEPLFTDDELSQEIKKIYEARKYPKATKPKVQLGPIHRSGQLPSWFCVKGLKPSPAEQLIIDQLNRYRIKWYREVAFEKFPSSKYGYYRYDFFIPSLRLVCEYDGRAWHEHPDRQKVDDMKNKFCGEHGIAVKRYSAKDYYKMEARIAELMKSYGVVLA